MRVRWDLHTNTIWPVGVETVLCQLAQLDLKGLWDVVFVNSLIISQWVKLLNPICSFWMRRQTQSCCLSSSCSSIHDRLICFFILKDFFWFFTLPVSSQRGYALVCQHKAEAQAQTKRAQRSNRSLGKNHRIFLQTHYTNESESVQCASV